MDARRREPERGEGRPGGAGFTYIGALFLVVLMTLVLVGTAHLWSTTSLRARERELLWVGTQYARALRLYYELSPGVKQYPLRLEELVTDRRGPTTRHHLRRLYPDPITRNAEWGLILGMDGRIVGVHSLSHDPPLQRGRFPPQWSDFDGLESYADWQFVADRSFSTTARRSAATAAGGSPPGADPPRSRIDTPGVRRPASAASPFRFER